MVNTCPACGKQLVVNSQAGIALCPDWHHWTSKPTAKIDAGDDLMMAEAGTLSARLALEADRSFAFMRDACAFAGKPPQSLFAAIALAFIDSLVQQYEGRMAGAVPEAERRAWIMQQIVSTTTMVVDMRVGKLEESGLPKATVN